MHECFAHVYVNILPVCLSKDIGTRGRNEYELPCGCWDSILGSLQEQMLLAAELALQSLMFSVNGHFLESLCAHP